MDDDTAFVSDRKGSVVVLSCANHLEGEFTQAHDAIGFHFLTNAYTVSVLINICTCLVAFQASVDYVTALSFFYQNALS